ncbi:S41 family peptidase [Flavobacterium sp.]|uniref:S41 family peptidase n=1 Tax=Flavobacterium sp. TaxID=239 RepID=UPI002B8BB892|nr:S41 family peptidase [Flavobacterium sp.]HSD08918.1 S41 family peptidase [Flavobacterium sp.]
MKKIILLILIITFQLGYSKEINETEKLSSLCKVWGFLKYYHPNVSKGDYNWDEQLLIILPKVEEAKNREELSKVYLEWIENLGVVKICKSCNDASKNEYFDKNFDLSWTRNTEMFTDELTQKLKYIEINRFQGTNHYVKSSNVGNVEITNETEYKDFNYPNENYRLLSIFKFWNIIEYFSPYKYKTDQNWNDVLYEMIPKFKNAKNEEDYHLAMLELSIKIDDTHSNLVTKTTNNFFGLKWIPSNFKIIDNKVILTNFYNDSLAKLNDLRIGDIIEKVDNKSINQIMLEKIKYINGSNYNTKLRNFEYGIFNGLTDSVNVFLNRNGKIINKNIGRYLWKTLNVKQKPKEKYKILDGNIGYVDMGEIERKDVDKMMNELKKTKAIIFDIRNYPKGTIYMVSKYLNETPKDFVTITKPDLTYPGKFLWAKNLKCGNNNKDFYKGKTVILVNEETQSHAEFTTMAFQTANNATTIGSQTAGADGDICKVEFIGGYKLYMTGIGIFYPDKSETQRTGIKIDLEIKPTIKGIQEGKDEVLEKAIEIIEAEK